METIGVNIIRYTGGAADAGHHADILLLVVHMGKSVEQGGKNGVVATAGTPFDHLVARKISLRIFFFRIGNKMSLCHNSFDFKVRNQA
jgi:hypothetical protein